MSSRASSSVSSAASIFTRMRGVMMSSAVMSFRRKTRRMTSASRDRMDRSRRACSTSAEISSSLVTFRRPGKKVSSTFSVPQTMGWRTVTRPRTGTAAAFAMPTWNRSPIVFGKISPKNTMTIVRTAVTSDTVTTKPSPRAAASADTLAAAVATIAVPTTFTTVFRMTIAEIAWWICSRNRRRTFAARPPSLASARARTSGRLMSAASDMEHRADRTTTDRPAATTVSMRGPRLPRGKSILWQTGPPGTRFDQFPDAACGEWVPKRYTGGTSTTG